jgi:Sporulation and spore germination
VISRRLVLITLLLLGLATGMSLYLWYLRSREVIAPTPQIAPSRITAPVARDSSATLSSQAASVPAVSSAQERGLEALRRLTEIYSSQNSPHPLRTGSEVRDVFLVSPDVAVIDVNSAFVSGQISGIFSEELTVVSVIETLSGNVPGVTKVKILVDGKEQDTLAGHADLTGSYDVAQVNEVAKRLASP